MRLIEPGLIDTLSRKIINRQQLHMRHPETGNMIKSGWNTAGTAGAVFRQAKVLPLMDNAARRMDG
ncbi:hypothetical protein D3C73_1226390 [compost metagenome]